MLKKSTNEEKHHLIFCINTSLLDGVICGILG